MIQKEVQSYIKEQSAFLLSIINKQYELYKDKMDEQSLQNLIKNTIQSTRYGNSGYFWINDFDYNIIMYPIKAELSGKIFKGSKDIPFIQLGVDKLNETGKDVAFIQI
jgi:methyl-accepting chemotaxis protein